MWKKSIPTTRQLHVCCSVCVVDDETTPTVQLDGNDVCRVTSVVLQTLLMWLVVGGTTTRLHV